MRISLYKIILVFLLFMLSLAPPAAAQSPEQSQHLAETAPDFPDISLPAPALAARFGLPAGPLRLSSLPESVIIINVYSWYCGPCQAEGADLKKLNAAIRGQGQEKHIRLIGIATGDDAALVERYRKRHDLDYALFPDSELLLHSQMGSPPVPSFFVIRREGKTLHHILTRTGSIAGKSDDFLKQIIGRINSESPR